MAAPGMGKNDFKVELNGIHLLSVPKKPGRRTEGR